MHERPQGTGRVSGAVVFARDLDLLAAYRVGDGALTAADHRAADTDHLGGHDLDAHDRPLLVQDHDEGLRRLAGVPTRWVEPRRRFALDLELLPPDGDRDHHLLLDHPTPHPHPLGRAPYRVDGQLLLGAGHRMISIVSHTRVVPASAQARFCGQYRERNGRPRCARTSRKSWSVCVAGTTSAEEERSAPIP